MVGHGTEFEAIQPMEVLRSTVGGMLDQVLSQAQNAGFFEGYEAGKRHAYTHAIWGILRKPMDVKRTRELAEHWLKQSDTSVEDLERIHDMKLPDAPPDELETL